MKIFKIFILTFVLFVASHPIAAAAAYSSIIDINIGKKTRISAAVASTPAERWQGLKGVKKMPKQYQGMLFVYKTEAMRYFTMEGTLMPLDFVFINSKQEVITIIFNRPAYPDFIMGKKPVTVSARAKYVLELPAGKVSEYGLKKGMRLDFKLMPEKEKPFFKLKVGEVLVLPGLPGIDDDEEPPIGGDIAPPSEPEAGAVQDPITELFMTPSVKSRPATRLKGKSAKPAVTPPKGAKPKKIKPPKPPKMIKSGHKSKT
jgi:uncharacterized membrane protein (UPF0127 family)